MRANKQEIKDCIAHFQHKGVYAYEHKGRVFVSFDLKNVCVEISANEIKMRAKLFKI